MVDAGGETQIRSVRDQHDRRRTHAVRDDRQHDGCRDESGDAPDTAHREVAVKQREREPRDRVANAATGFRDLEVPRRQAEEITLAIDRQAEELMAPTAKSAVNSINGSMAHS
jgi:hypothetical protein